MPRDAPVTGATLPLSLVEVCCSSSHLKSSDSSFALTARVALRATRWWAEKQIHQRYVPSWVILRAMGASIDFVKILANYVGGGITTDQI